MNEDVKCVPPAETPAGTAHWLKRPGHSGDCLWALWDGSAWRFGFGGAMRGTSVVVGQPACPRRLTAQGYRYHAPVCDQALEWISVSY